MDEDHEGNRMDDFLTIRCANNSNHPVNGDRKEGNIVAFIGKNEIIVRCIDSHCKFWTKIEFSLPGIDLDLRKAGLNQKSIRPGSITWKTGKASVIIDDE